MARYVTGGIVAKLREETSIERLVEGCGVVLAKGRGKAPKRTGDCLFCGTVKSLTVDPAGNSWACSSCSLSGSVVEWVQHAEGVSFTHAVELLREGTPITATGARGGRKPPKVNTRSLLPTPFDVGQPDEVLLGQVVDFYHRTLREAWEPAEWLARRRLDSPELVEVFRLGFANRSLGLRLPDTHRIVGSQLRSQLQNIGVYARSGHEAYDGSIVVPVVDDAGTTVQLYGRKMGNALRKGTRLHTWLNDDTKPLFNPDGLTHGNGEVIVAGSIIDALTFWAAGIRNVIAIPPTGFTFGHIEALDRNDIGRVLIAFRRDDDGDRAAGALTAMLSTTIKAECLRVEFPRGADANDVARKAATPADALTAAVRSAVWISGHPTHPKTAPVAPAPVVEAKPSDEPTPSSGLPTPALSRAVPASKPVVVIDKPDVEDLGRQDHTAPAIDEPLDNEAIDEEAIDEEAIADAVVVDEEAVVVEQPSAGPVPSADLSANGEEMWLTFGARRWRLRGLAKNTSFDVLKVQVMVTGDGPRGVGFHVDHVDLYSARARAAFCREAATEANIEEAILKRDLAKVFSAAEAHVEEAIRRAQEPVDTTVRLDPDERAAALELLTDPKLCDRIVADFAKAGMVGESTNCLVGYLAAVSRLLDRPLAVVVQSTSAAGKSALMDAVLDFVPEEGRVSYSAMTGQSLYYMGEHELAHKVLSVAEEEGAERASYALKLLQSEGALSIASTGKDTTTGRLVTHPYRVEGPAAIFLTTTAIDIDEELLNRCIVLTVDEDRAQTRAIHDRQRRAHTLDGLLAANTRDAVLKVHRDAQRLLEPLAVVNPYANRLGFVDTATRTRRDHVKYLTLISAIALLHQHQRERHTARTSTGAEVVYIEATLDDIGLANRLAHEVLGRSLDELPPQTRRVLGIIDTWVGKRAADREIDRTKVRFTRRELREACGLSDMQCRKHLDRLVELEYVVIHKGAPGSLFVYELLFDGDPHGNRPHLAGLVAVEDLHDDPTSPTSTPQPATSTPRTPNFDPRSTPERPPVDPTSTPTGNGTPPAPTPSNGTSTTKTGVAGNGHNGASRPQVVTRADPPMIVVEPRPARTRNGARTKAAS